MSETKFKIPGGKELIDAQSLMEKLNIEEKMQIADLGCGRRGYFSLQAAKLVGPQGLVCAIDVVKPALENVQSMANLFGITNIKTIWADLEIPKATKIPDETIDIAMINNVFFQTKRGNLIVKEAARILKKGGRLLVTDWKKTKAPFGPPVENRVSPEQIKAYARDCGLTLTKEFEAGPYHYALIFARN